ncbi:MAG: hypothetical protein U9Q37_08955 [Euryarchaeota archaeon]|nr:hypothetical protein [Euryarchaeota archaeon]
MKRLDPGVSTINKKDASVGAVGLERAGRWLMEHRVGDLPRVAPSLPPDFR